jgi:hypothetical protein
MRSFCSVLSMPDIQSYVHGSLEFTGSSARSASLSRPDRAGTRCIAAAL